MANWKPGAYAVGIILIIGFIFPLLVSGFIEVDSIQPTGIMNDTIDILDNGYNFTIHLPIVPDVEGTLPSPVPEVLQEPIIDRLYFMSLIPSIVLIPLLILCLLGIVWTVVKLVLP